ncbi:hypothetical protein NPIL_363061 [Nephila pilipes]|uniref:Uncharacterized protein n=1 Tax=Nephila pilipes TaxID=299642 RepID=A0A8X6P5Z7_NEPPI|nr:hypothetical protein NPIL_363061 [Nephila pilipes]
MKWTKVMIQDPSSLAYLQIWTTPAPPVTEDEKLKKRIQYVAQMKEIQRSQFALFDSINMNQEDTEYMTCLVMIKKRNKELELLEKRRVVPCKKADVLHCLETRFCIHFEAKCGLLLDIMYLGANVPRHTIDRDCQLWKFHCSKE